MAKKADNKKKAAKTVDPEKAAKRAARAEAMKNRPAVQRPNSKQIDIIADEFDKSGNPKGKCVKSFAYPVKKLGSLVTTVAYDEKGNVVGVATTFVPGCKVKSKKGHGYLQYGVAGVGKGKGKEEDEDDEDGGEEESAEAAPVKPAAKKTKKND